MGLECFAKDYSNVDILLHIDNATAIACINKMKSVQFANLHDESRAIWSRCESQKIRIFASYIKSEENIEADEKSRKLLADTEWELADWAFEKIKNELGLFDIDLFTSFKN